MSEPISGNRLAELAERLTTNFECWIFSDVKRAEAVELVANAFLERRKAEEERKKEYGIRGPYRVNGPFPQAEVDAHMRMYPNAKPVWRYAAGEWRDL